MPKKILFVADHIDKEGTSKIILSLVNGLSIFQDKIDVSLLLFHDKNEVFGEDINDIVNVNNLCLKGRIRSSVCKIVSSVLSSNPDVVFVTYTQHMPLFALIGLYLRFYNIKMLFRDTIIPSMYRGNTNWLTKKFLSFCYNQYNLIIAQSQDMRSDLVNNWDVSDKRIVVINNPINIPDDKQGVILSKRSNTKRLHFVAIGRLEHQKGYDILIDRIASLNESERFKVSILGKGSLEAQLKKQAKDKGIEDLVDFVGFVQCPMNYLEKSDGLILPSRYEGFPNVVLEANAIGKPVFCNKCPGGINEIIIEGSNGVSCDFGNQDDFERGLKKYKNITFGTKEIITLTKGRYGKEKILKAYLSVFLSL